MSTHVEREVNWLRQLDETTSSERRNVLLGLVVEEFRRALLFDEDEPLPLDESYFALGLSSLGAVEMRERLEIAVGRRVDSASLFNNPTILHLLDHLCSEVIPERFAVETAPGTGADHDDEVARKQQRKQLLSGVLRDLYDS